MYPLGSLVALGFFLDFLKRYIYNNYLKRSNGYSTYYTLNVEYKHHVLEDI